MTWSEKAADLANASHVAFLRLLALAYIVFAVFVWGQVIGADLPFVEPLLTLPGPQQATSVILAVMLPVTAMGLWSLQPWGQVVWGLTVTVHIVALLRGWEISAAVGWLLAFHLATLIVFLIVSGARLVANRT